ncbi:hypothetical protein ES707_22142 [subsurface metagenome]
MIDEMGKTIIEDINESFKVKIPLNEQTSKEMGELVDIIVTEHAYGLCDNCDRRISAC